MQQSKFGYPYDYGASVTFGIWFQKELELA